MLEKWCGGAYLLWKSIGGDPKEKGSKREKKRGCLCAHCASYIGRCTVEDVFIYFFLGFRWSTSHLRYVRPLSVGLRDLFQAQKWMMLLPAEQIKKKYNFFTQNSPGWKKLLFWEFISLYSRVHIISDEVFSKILKKPSIVQKKMMPHMKAFGLFNKMKQKKKFNQSY